MSRLNTEMNLHKFTAGEYDWEIWLQENFDPEIPRKIEATDHGLEYGFRLFPERQLIEGVLADGSPGFLVFNLCLSAGKCDFILNADQDG